MKQTCSIDIFFNYSNIRNFLTEAKLVTESYRETYRIRILINNDV